MDAWAIMLIVFFSICLAIVIGVVVFACCIGCWCGREFIEKTREGCPIMCSCIDDCCKGIGPICDNCMKAIGPVGV